MKQKTTPYIYILFLVVFCNGIYSQNLTLRITSKNKSENKILNKLNYIQKHKDLKSLKKETTKISNHLKNIGYFTHKIDSFKKLNSFYTVFFDLNKKTKKAIIEFSKKTKSYTNLKLNEDYILEIPINQLQTLLNDISTSLDNNGKSFSKVQLKNINIKGENLYGEIQIKESKKRTLDKIIIKNYRDFPNNFIKNYFNLNDNSLINKKKVKQIALIAKNGTGKTSILNIISGAEKPDSGVVSYRKDIRISYLEQEPKMNADLTIEETIFASDNEVLKVISNYEKAILNPDDEEKYQTAFDEMERFGAWDFETQYKQILSKLKLDDTKLKVGKLSGGQKKRLALANALINRPDLLILDEPTNHLDLEMIEWLENYFAKENITLFMVTHDRYFLERVCNEIIELDNNTLYPYKGNYSYYLEKKEARLQLEATELHKSKRLFKKELTWMRRQPKARTTKSKSRISDFQEIKAKAHQRRKDHEVELEINMERIGSKIMELHKISKSYPDKPILDKFEYNLNPNFSYLYKILTFKSTQL